MECSCCSLLYCRSSAPRSDTHRVVYAHTAHTDLLVTQLNVCIFVYVFCFIYCIQLWCIRRECWYRNVKNAIKCLQRLWACSAFFNLGAHQLSPKNVQSWQLMAFCQCVPPLCLFTGTRVCLNVVEMETRRLQIHKSCSSPSDLHIHRICL